MEVIPEIQFRKDLPLYLKRIREGALFLCPTDTIYGLSCSALDVKAIARLQQLKGRTGKPFSVWVPSLKWIQLNCDVGKKGREWLKKLPGAYTLILPLKNRKAVAPSLVKNSCIGVRLPDHWFSGIVAELGIPLVTTSANKSGELFMTCRDDLDPDIRQGVEFLIDEGTKKARPSTLVHVETEDVQER